MSDRSDGDHGVGLLAFILGGVVVLVLAIALFLFLDEGTGGDVNIEPPSTPAAASGSR